MKDYICSACKQSFQVPDGNYSKVHCPVCDGVETSAKPQEVRRINVAPVNPRHPLDLPVWIMTICLCLITVVYVGLPALFYAVVFNVLSTIAK